MKILEALFFPPQQPGGVSSMVPYICRSFNQMPGWKADLFYLPKRVRGKGVGDLPFQTIRPDDYKESTTVARYLQVIRDYLWWTKLRMQDSYELIHAHHPVAALVMKAVFPDTPVIITIHSSFERELLLNGKIEKDSLEERFLIALYRELEAVTDGILTVSESFRQYLIPYVEQPERIVVIPNGFDPNRFRPIPHDSKVPQLVTLCRLVPAKGIDVLLKACAMIKKRGYEFVLHIIGDGDSREQLEQIAQDLQIYDETIFYGYTLHPEEFMPYFDIFVLPSRAEAFGNVFAEAALCRLALVGTDVGGISEQIQHGHNGLLVPVNRETELADALEKMIVDPELRHRLADNAYDKAMSDYSLGRVIQEMERVYKEFV